MRPILLSLGMAHCHACCPMLWYEVEPPSFLRCIPQSGVATSVSSLASSNRSLGKLDMSLRDNVGLSKEKRGFVAGTTAVTDELTRHASDVGLFRAGQSGTSQMSDDAKGIGLSESKVVLCAPFVLTSAWVEAALSAAPLLSSVSRK